MSTKLLAPASGMLDAGSRARVMAELARRSELRQPIDLLVIGGGATGAGIALDAVTRGLSVALVEKRDLAFGTSRWSSKLIHGGLRYLAKGDIGVAMESAKERGILMTRTAPHLTRALPFLAPVNAGVPRSFGTALSMGARASNLLRFVAGTSRRVLPVPRWVTATEALTWAPTISRSKLRGAVLWWDGQLEDDVRLVVGLARTAAAYGAQIATYCSVLSATGQGARLRDERTGQTIDLPARWVINATGVWSGSIDPAVRIRPSKGVHLVFRSSVLGHARAAVTAPILGTVSRGVFALPQSDGLTFLGLTDDPITGPIPDVPLVEASEEQFLLQTLSRVLERPLGSSDVVGRFAGVRPLLESARRSSADVSRRHTIVTGPDGLLTIVGGKLTTYRKMAQDVVDRVSPRPCQTAQLPLLGAVGPLASGVPDRLIRRYGAEASSVAALADGRPELLAPVAPGLAVLGVELLWGIRAEGALTVEDLLERRTRLSLVAEDAELARPAAQRLLEAPTAVAAS